MATGHKLSLQEVRVLFAQGWIPSNPNGDNYSHKQQAPNCWLGRYTRQHKSGCQQVFILLQFTAEGLILTRDAPNRFALQLEGRLCSESKTVPRDAEDGSWVISSGVRQQSPDPNHFHPNNAEWTLKASDFWKKPTKQIRTELYPIER